MTREVLFGISVRLLLAWLLLATLGFFFGKQLMTLLLPLFTWVINLVQDDYRPALEITSSADTLISMTAITRHALPPFYNPGAKLTAGAHIAHSLVPLVLLLSILVAWPTKQFKQRIKLVLMGIPLNLIVAALTLPFQLMGSIEIMFQEMAMQYRITRNIPFVLTWMLFLEVGGRLVIAIAFAILTGLVMQRNSVSL